MEGTRTVGGGSPEQYLSPHREGTRIVGGKSTKRALRQMVQDADDHNRALRTMPESHPRCLYVMRKPEGGSRYKFRRMFERLFDIVQNVIDMLYPD